MKSFQRKLSIGTSEELIIEVEYVFVSKSQISLKNSKMIKKLVSFHIKGTSVSSRFLLLVSSGCKLQKTGGLCLYFSL